jgi:hypothetical protein
MFNFEQTFSLRSAITCGSTELNTMAANLKYPWQQSVVDAMAETDATRQALKLAAAEEAIAARLCEAPGAEERRALGNALTSLKMLFPGNPNAGETG